MRNWHIQFEKLEPEAHQEFLESLKIDVEEIKSIRKWSGKGEVLLAGCFLKMKKNAP